MQLSFLCGQQPEPSSDKIRWMERGEPRGASVPQGTLGEQNGDGQVLAAYSHNLRYWNVTGWLDIHSFLLCSSVFAYGLVHHGNVLFQEIDPAVVIMFVIQGSGYEGYIDHVWLIWLGTFLS